MNETLANLPRSKAEALMAALGMKFSLDTTMNLTDGDMGNYEVLYEPDKCATKHVVIQAYVDGWIDRETAGV